MTGTGIGSTQLFVVPVGATKTWAAVVVGGVGWMTLVPVSGCISSEGSAITDAGPDASAGTCSPGQPGCEGDSGGGNTGGGSSSGGSSSNGGGSGAEAAATGCASDSDCQSTGTSCATTSCSAHACLTARTPLGVPCTDHGGLVCDGQGKCTTSHCSDGVQDADETGTDCGGPTCGKCAAGASCRANTDCATGDCQAGTCVTCGTIASTQTCCPDGTGVTLVDTQTFCATEGTHWTSCDGRFEFIMQGDGNLVLYEGVCAGTRCGTALWASHTNGCGGCVSMQDDGNLVVYDGSRMQPGDACWASGTPGNPGAFLQLQNDGDLVMFPGAGDGGVASGAGVLSDAGDSGSPSGSIWSTNTCCH